MRLDTVPYSDSFAWRAGALLAAVLLVAGCSTAADQSGTNRSQSAPSSQSQSAPSQPPSDAGFYLRIWQTQALAPQATFAPLPSVTISDGQFIDGLVAVPAIYPGPLWIAPSERSISAAGIALIVDQARADGLLGATRDFTDGGVAGAVTGHVEIVVDGVTYDLTGPVSMPDRVPATPGTAGAFEEFWQKMGDTIEWLDPSLGPAATYEPTRLAVLAMPPTEATPGIAPSETAWPLPTPFSSFGTVYGGAGNRCMVVAGKELAALAPVVKRANQLTRFVDAQGARDSILVRVLVPGEPDPC